MTVADGDYDERLEADEALREQEWEEHDSALRDADVWKLEDHVAELAEGVFLMLRADGRYDSCATPLMAYIASRRQLDIVCRTELDGEWQKMFKESDGKWPRFRHARLTLELEKVRGGLPS